ncbi:MAG: DUF1465 family protein [Alphaproteobacteria bacterium]|nr:DUF1465 family protein [Alphaproteobacteria bacterium]
MQGETPTAFFSKTYDEATSLLIEARDYIAAEESLDRRELAPADRLRLALETSRLTSRLTHVMAWLLARKAVFAGELTPAEAAEPPYVLERNEILAADEAAQHENLPETLSDLMVRSHRLYIRVSRLDELVRRGAFATPPITH